MRYRLINQNDPDVTLGLTSSTWYGILDMAQDYGWNPMGTILPDWQIGYLGIPGLEDLNDRHGEYWSDEVRLVLFEDALNMADALDEAFIDYEPEYIHSLYSYVKFLENRTLNGSQPSLGAIQKVIEMCQLGSFEIERF